MIIVRIAVSVVLALLAGPAAGQDTTLRGLFLQTRPSRPGADPQQAASPPPTLGHSLFLRESSGRPVRVSPLRRFQEGDAVRILVESNIDGHLYVFDREGEGPLRMIFPDVRIRRGENRLAAHVPLLIPGETPEGAGDAPWFVISGPPQAERLYLVFAREPIGAWPRGEQLLRYPGTFEVPWPYFGQAVGAEAQQVITEAARDEGVLFSAAERLSLDRGLRLSRSDPLPSVLRINKQPKAQRLVSEIELKRR